MRETDIGQAELTGDSAGQPLYTVTTSSGSDTVALQNIIGVTQQPGTSRLMCTTSAEPGNPAHLQYREATVTSTSDPTPQKYAADIKPDSLNSSTHRILVVISVLSGKEAALPVYENALLPFLTSLGLNDGKDYTVHRTTSPSSITELTEAVILPTAIKGDRQTIILLSGDGGIVDIINAVLSKTPTPPSTYVKPTIGLLPLGTGNALGNSSGILADQTLGLSTLLRGTPAPLPLFAVAFDPPARRSHQGTLDAAQPPVATAYGAVVFSWGLHAALVADSDTPAYRAHGAGRFGMAAKENLFPADGGPPHAYRGTLALAGADGAGPPTTVDRAEHNYVLATLCSQLEAGFVVSPASRPLDGTLRVVHFGPQPDGGQGVMGLMKGAYDGGRHVEHDAVGYEAISELRLRIDEQDERWRRVCVDGTIFVVPAGGTVRVTTAGVPNVVDLLWLKR